jgi:hypothetical protein
MHIKNSKTEALTSLLLGASLLSLVACGGGGSSSGSGTNLDKKDESVSSRTNTEETNPTTEPTDSNSPTVEKEPNGVYQGLFRPINEKLLGKLNGALNISRKNNEIVFDVRINGIPAWSVHPQSIYEGTRCPTPADDINKDGFIDIVEGQKVYGSVIIPLDGDLNNQKARSAWHPVSDQFGHYIYSEKADFDQFFMDLQKKDEDLTDNIIKIDSSTGLNLVGKVVVIHGVHENTNLPATVVSMNGMPKHESIPVACAVIGRLNGGPNSEEEDLPTVVVDENVGETVGGSNTTGGDTSTLNEVLVSEEENSI